MNKTDLGNLSPLYFFKNPWILWNKFPPLTFSFPHTLSSAHTFLTQIHMTCSWWITPPQSASASLPVITTSIKSPQNPEHSDVPEIYFGARPSAASTLFPSRDDWSLEKSQTVKG